IVFSDTPGILEPHYLLQEKMMDFVNSSLQDADAVLFISDLSETYMDQDMVERIKSIKVPVIVVINKVDLSTTEEINKLVHGWKKIIKPHAVVPTSAKLNFNADKIKEALLEVMPEAPAYFSKDDLSDA